MFRLEADGAQKLQARDACGARAIADETRTGDIAAGELQRVEQAGCGAIIFTISWVTAPLTETPKNTSASIMACSSVRADVFTA